MVEEKSSDNLKQLFTTLSELSKYATAMLGYFIAIAGISPQYPNLVSVVTILITTVAVWLWRWSWISKKLISPAALQIMNVENTPAKDVGRPIGKIWEPFRPSSRHTFMFPLVRRRAELTVLLSLTVFSLWFSGLKTPKVYEELSGLECAYAVQNRAPWVIISNFYVASGTATAFEENMFSQLRNQFDREITVCRYKRVIENGQVAEELGKRGSQTIVIWGVSDSDYFQLHITPIDWSGLELSWKASQENSRALRDWSIEYVSRIVLLQVGLINGQAGREIRDLYTALDAASQEEWAMVNLKQLAPAYYLVGTLFGDEGNLTGAIEAYTKTIEVDTSYDIAFLSRGNAYVLADEIQLALADFNELIRRNSFLAADAYANRAQIQLDWEAKKSDLLKAIEIHPEETFYYHLLGYSALIEGDMLTARTAYENSLDYLDADTRAVFIDELNELALQEPSMQEDIVSITNLLQEANLQ